MTYDEKLNIRYYTKMLQEVESFPDPMIPRQGKIPHNVDTNVALPHTQGKNNFYKCSRYTYSLVSPIGPSSNYMGC
jgi:hypothetical protein